ncbi:response regulator [Loktanella sp. DJP18]|uniref:response regulator n=1 Tax=Loktanella sp. DJP18 TaxID=3409788 RepID=UPI003BB7B639
MGYGSVIIGYMVVSIVAGVIGSATALLMGASFWLAFWVYTLVGFTTMIVLPVAHLVSTRIVRHSSPQADSATTGNLDTAHPVAPPADRAANPAMTILAVDDDPFILELVTVIGANAGDFRIVTAASGHDALRLLAQPEITFDYLLFDINMPDMNGIELCRQVRQMTAYQDSPIVMLTAKRDMENMGEAFRAGATDYVTKPFEVDELLNRFQMAHQMLKAPYGANTAATKDTLAAGLDHPQMQMADTLVDLRALSNYLTRLSQQDAAIVQVLALKIDQVEAMRARYAPAQFTALLDDVAAAAADCLGVDQTVMSYTTDDDLVIATSTATPQVMSDLEANVLCCLMDHALDDEGDDGTGTGSVSVGGPVSLQGARSQRARIAIDRAIGLAEDQALSRHRNTVARTSSGA